MARKQERSGQGKAFTGRAQTYWMAAAVLLLLLVAAVDRAAENCRPRFFSKDKLPQSALANLPKAVPAPTAAPKAASKPEARLEPEKVEPKSPTVPAKKNAWSYFHPFWTREFNPTVAQIFPQRADAVGSARLVRLLDDPKHRLESEFRIPLAMRERVLFWMNVHSRFDTRMRLLHDRVHPGIVYGYADFTEIYEAADTRAKGDANAFRLEREVVKELRARLLEAGGYSDTHLLTPWEKLQLKTFISSAGAYSVDGIYKMLSNVRSQTGQRDEFLAALERSEHLLPYIEMEFQRNDLPAALGHIPFVESAFNWRARSKVGAMGIWQFMPETARQMLGMDPTYWADPLRQTRGAIKLLKIFRSQVPDWSTAVTSYNSGAGRLRHLCQKYRTNSIVKLLDVSDGESLGFAGKNFYAQFLSVNLVENYKLDLFPELRRRQEEDLLVFRNVVPFERRFRNTY